ncbi:GNAT family N-acetyltransferase [Acidocella sp.]|uniref:GNAT family N-acetyltransferase n=1 Tax=Acidocella sp. TaxID=50710 RepID=UPI002607ED93|nr:GNAT family N-acetyltransferase [Acidocella sp.]
MDIRDAQGADLPGIQAIYAHHVLTGAGTFEDVAPSLEDMTARFDAKIAAGFAWLVATDASGILGFAYYGPFRDRAAYRHTVEDSVYVRDGVRGQGVGKALVSALLERARASNFKQMLALIGDSENTASIGVHASLGFQHCGTMRKVGYKFDRWLDVVIMQKAL